MIVNEKEFSSRHTQFRGLALNTTCCSQNLGAAYNYWAPQNNGTWEMVHFQTGICLTGTVPKNSSKKSWWIPEAKKVQMMGSSSFPQRIGELTSMISRFVARSRIRVRVRKAGKTCGESTTRKEVDKVKIMGGYPILESWENMICNYMYLVVLQLLILYSD